LNIGRFIVMYLLRLKFAPIFTRLDGKWWEPSSD